MTPTPQAPDPGSPWSHPEALEKVPAEVPTPEKPLVLAGHGHAIQGARLEVDVTTWLPDPEAGGYRYAPDRATARYALEIDVDERSDEDGLPAEWTRNVGEREDRGENVPSDMRYAHPVTLVPAPRKR